MEWLCRSISMLRHFLKSKFPMMIYYNSSTPSLLLPTDRGSIYIETSAIMRVEAKSNYSCLHFSNGKKLVVAKVLRWFENKLPQTQFLRIHRTHLLNANHVKKIITTDNNLYFVLPDGGKIKVSNRKKRQFMLQ